MTNERARNEPLSAKTAFVVHLTRNDEGSGLSGRVEHVTSGHSLRFASVEQLVSFMQRAAGDNAQNETSTFTAQERRDGMRSGGRSRRDSVTEEG